MSTTPHLPRRVKMPKANSEVPAAFNPPSATEVMAEYTRRFYPAPLKGVTKLSLVLAEASLAATEAAALRGKAREEPLRRLRAYWAVAEAQWPHTDDNVETIRLYLDGCDTIINPTYVLREIATKLNVLVRCVEWVEATQSKETTP